MRLREEKEHQKDIYAGNHPEVLRRVCLVQTFKCDVESKVQVSVTRTVLVNTHCLMQSGIDTYSMGTSSASSARL